MPATHSEAAADSLLQIRVTAIWQTLRRQPASFWLINIYLMLEYVRPQQVWEFLDVAPWGLLTLVMTVGAFFLEGKAMRLHTGASALLAVFTIVLVLSSVTALHPTAAYEKWELYFSWVLIYLLITNIVTTEKRFFIFVLAFLLYSFKMSQHGFRSWMMSGFAFTDWGVTGAPGWFHNSGEVGIQMCVFLPMSVEFILALRHHWGRYTRYFFYLFPFTAVATIIASSSRGAILGAAAVGLWWIARSNQKLRSLVLILLAGVIAWTVVPPEQKLRFTTAGEDETSVTRIERWQAGIEMANDRPVLGIGYNNWGVVYGPLSHNIFIEAWSELGYSGLMAFLGLIAATFAVNASTRRVLRAVPTSTYFLRHMAFGLDGALIGFLVSGFFITVLYYPYFWINLAMTVALHVAARNEQRSFRRHGRMSAIAHTHHPARAAGMIQ